jgi:hypothetical protein
MSSLYRYAAAIIVRSQKAAPDREARQDGFPVFAKEIRPEAKGPD